MEFSFFWFRRVCCFVNCLGHLRLLTQHCTQLNNSVRSPWHEHSPVTVEHRRFQSYLFCNYGKNKVMRPQYNLASCSLICVLAILNDKWSDFYVLLIQKCCAGSRCSWPGTYQPISLKHDKHQQFCCGFLKELKVGVFKEMGVSFCVI